MYLDKSKVNTYLACPKRFELQFIKKISPPPTPESEIGRHFHKISNLFYEKIDKDKLLNTTNVFSYFKEVIEELLREFSPPIPTILFKNFINFEGTRWLMCKKTANPIDYFFPLYREEEFKAPNYELNGRIDRLFKEPKGLFLLEIKTGEVPVYQNSKKALERELAIYYIILRENNLKPYKCGAYFPRVNKVVYFRIGDYQIAKALRDVRKVRMGIYEMNFKPSYSGLCRYCPYASLCLFKK